MSYKVTLISPPVPFPFKPDYFPRLFRYKKDAEQLKRAVEANGGQAKLEKVK